MERDPLRSQPAGPATGPTTPTESGPSGEPPAPSDAASSLLRIEKLIGEIRAGLDARFREHAHKDFSPAWLAGAILQVLVVGLVAMAGTDCLFQAPVGRPVLKLAFALVLQAMALTAFVVAGGGRR